VEETGLARSGYFGTRAGKSCLNETCVVIDIEVVANLMIIKVFVVALQQYRQARSISKKAYKAFDQSPPDPFWKKVFNFILCGKRRTTSADAVDVEVSNRSLFDTRCVLFVVLLILLLKEKTIILAKKTTLDIDT
jgi:hypothetical protein